MKIGLGDHYETIETLDVETWRDRLIWWASAAVLLTAFICIAIEAIVLTASRKLKQLVS